jgi:hypothetical protein
VRNQETLCDLIADQQIAGRLLLLRELLLRILLLLCELHIGQRSTDQHHSSAE